MVFLISLLCSPKHISCMDEASLLGGLDRCFAALRGYQSRSRTAGRCRKFLVSVEQEVFHYRSQNGLSPPTSSLIYHQADTYGRNAGMTNGVGVLETPGTTAALGSGNGYMYARPDTSSWNKDVISRPDIVQQDIHFDQHLWMCNTPDIAWLSHGSYHAGDL